MPWASPVDPSSSAARPAQLVPRGFHLIGVLSIAVAVIAGTVGALLVLLLKDLSSVTRALEASLAPLAILVGFAYLGLDREAAPTQPTLKGRIAQEARGLIGIFATLAVFATLVHLGVSPTRGHHHSGRNLELNGLAEADWGLSQLSAASAVLLTVVSLGLFVRLSAVRTLLMSPDWEILLSRRISARLIDAGLVAPPLVLVWALLTCLGWPWQWFLGTGIGVVFVYEVLAGIQGRSYGKKWLGIGIVVPDSKRGCRLVHPAMCRASVRALCVALAAAGLLTLAYAILASKASLSPSPLWLDYLILGSAVVQLALIVSATSHSRQQGFHDVFAGTVLERVPRRTSDSRAATESPAIPARSA